MTGTTMIGKTICRASALMILVLFLEMAAFARTAASQDFVVTSLGDYGNVTVMETAGNYDAKNADGTVNAGPRQIIAKEFLRTHKDEFDFLVIFSNFEFPMPNSEARAFYLGVKNDTAGIGKELFDHTGSFGSAGSLQGMIDMGNVAGLTVDPLDPKFEDTLRLLSHEMMHRWGAYAQFKNASGMPSKALLGIDNEHWSYLLSSTSVLYGNQWQDNGNNTFTSLGEGNNYSPLDLYLMGLAGKDKVPPLLLIDDQSIDPSQRPQAGVSITGTAMTVTIDDIISAIGPRVPDASVSPKTFKTAFIFITRPDTFRADAINGIENIRNGAVTRFSVLTDGQAVMQIASTRKEDIPFNPGITLPVITPRTVPPNINDGVQWLMNNQQSDGSWSDHAQTSNRDTAGTVRLLMNFTSALQSYQSGFAWLTGNSTDNVDYLARKIQTLADTGHVVAPLVQDMLSRQNTDGGWGSGQHYASGNTDTALALNALAAAGYNDPGVLSKAVGYLQSKQNPDGGWGSEDKGGMVQETATVLSAFNHYRTKYQLDDAIARGTVWLINKQNADGGFGNSPSTVYDTAVATMTLRELNVSTDITNKALDYIQGQQSENGSWYQSVYQTALAVEAMYKATVDPDLAIKSSDISIIPATIKSLPTNIVINANISNLGQTGAQAKVALYEGSIADQNKIGEQTIAFPGQASTTVTFSAAAKDGSEHRFYMVVDPDNAVKESNELNNIAVKILSPEATYDFEVLSPDITVSANPAEMSQDVKVTAKITNKGTMNAYNVQVKYFIDDPAAPFNIGTQTVDIPAGATITDEITWRANKAGVNMPLTVQADPFDTVNEISETNNQASRPITVNANTRPNLTISYKDIVITPSPANQSGTANISALVKNEGSSTAHDVNVSVSSAVTGTIGAQTIDMLAPGESKRVAVDWTNIPVSGNQNIIVRTIFAGPEIRTDDNDTFVTMKILSLPDLALATSSIAFSPSAPKEGAPVTIMVTVQNKGEQTASNVVVRLSEGNAVLGNQIIPSLAGNATATVSLAYDTAAKKGSHIITAVADPDNAIAEQNKDNNSASRPLGVQDSSLWAAEQYISPNGDGVKDSTELFFRLQDAATVSIRIVNKNKEAVRTFTGPELVNTTGGGIRWDGLNDSGVVVDDGEYQFQVMESSGNVRASLQVFVDNNRSALTDAIGTKYLLNNNLTCALPYIWPEDRVWLQDDSGILFTIRDTSQEAPGYPAGLYTMAPTGEDIFRIIPADWNEDNATYEYSGFRQNPAPNREKTAFTLRKADRNTNISADELWIVNIDGSGLSPIVQSGSSYSIDEVKWSPDNSSLAYTIYKNSGTYEIWVVDTNTMERTLLESAVSIANLKWSPDGKELAFIAAVNVSYSQRYELRKADKAGKITIIYTSDGAEIPFRDAWAFDGLEWLGNEKMLYPTSAHQPRATWLLDMSGNGVHSAVSSRTFDIALASDRKRVVFDEYAGGKTVSVKMSDSNGNLSTLYETPAMPAYWRENDGRKVAGIVWSPDGGKIAFADRAYTKIDACLYEPALIVVDATTKNTKTFGFAEASCHAINGCSTAAYSACIDSGQREWTDGVVSWMADNSHLLLESEQQAGDNQRSYFLVQSGTGERKGMLPIVGYWNSSVGVSPQGRYITYEESADPSSACFESQGPDLWALSSILNLTADLQTTRSKSAIILKGIAADRNFEGFLLEYTDARSPDAWTPVQPVSDVPVVNDVFTQWVPPYEGSFYVRLTVWDKAGNTAVSRKSVFWGQHSSITNLYKSLEIFSPNNDGVKDTVELNYRVLDPVHLEFTIYDDANNLIKIYYKDYAAPKADFLRWDGTNESHNVVPDGKYKIKVFDYEFFVEVDNTPPNVHIELSPIVKTNESAISEFFTGYVYYKVIMSGIAYDKNFKHWTVEYGKGDNPQEWFPYREGGTILVNNDNTGNPLNQAIDSFAFTIAVKNDDERVTLLNSIEDLVGNRYRITAEDSAGNKITHISNMLEEQLLATFNSEVQQMSERLPMVF